ncbi:MAG: F0F1 ATP synthase subunit A [Bradymonadaceae bacterium]
MAEDTILEPVKQAAEGAILQGEEWSDIFGQPLFGSEHVSVNHLLMTGVVLVIIAVFAFAARGKYTGSREEAIIPEEGMSARNFLEAIFDYTLDTMSQVMPREEAKTYFPLIIALTVFILFSNLLGLIPGFVPPTQNFNTGASMAFAVFVCYHLIGLFKHGLAYFEEFLSPASVKDLVGDQPSAVVYAAGATFWLVLSALFVVIEGISHAFRPISLAVRLTGNMGGDHTVLGISNRLAEMTIGEPLLFMIPFLFLGLIVSIIQAMIFALLSVAYIALAVEEGH